MVAGQRYWLWRAVDEGGQTFYMLRAEARDTVAAECYFRAATRELFRPRRHLLTDTAYRATVCERAPIWRGVVGLAA